MTSKSKKQQNVLPSAPSSVAAQELKECAQQLAKTKSDTCLLYRLKRLVDKHCLAMSNNEKMQSATNKTIEYRDVLVECLNTIKGLPPSKLFDSLFERCIQVKDKEMCTVFIRNVQMLDEKHAVDCLKFFFSADSPTSQSFDVYKEKLNLIFSLNYDYRFLSNELRRLSSNEFIICLQYLQNSLKASFQSNGDETPPSQSAEEPSVLQLTDLFSCFVDAHFSHITLSVESQEIVADVLQMIDAQLDLFMDLISIESLVRERTQLKEKLLAVNSAAIEDPTYRIEMLKLI